VGSLPVIRTIADLDRYSDSVVKQVAKTIDLKKIAMQQLEKDGHSEGLLAEEWDDYMESIVPITCPTCKGEGTVIPGVRALGVVHASSAHKCTRKLYHDVMGDIRPKGYIPPKLRIIFEIGHAIHDLVQKALKRALGDDFEPEVTVDHLDALILGGHADGVARLEFCTVVLEIKTISADGYKKLTKPKDEHILQAAALYARGLDIPFVCFIYIDKASGNMKQYIHVYNEDDFRRWWAQKGRKVEQAVIDGVPPVADANKWECKDCPYEHGCEASLTTTRERFRTKDRMRRRK